MTGLYLKDRFTHNIYLISKIHEDVTHLPMIELDLIDLNGDYVNTIRLKELFNGQYDLYDNLKFIKNSFSESDISEDDIAIDTTKPLSLSFTAKNARARADRYHNISQVLVNKISKSIKDEASKGQYGVAIGLEPDLFLETYYQIKQIFINAGYIVEPYNRVESQPLRCFSKDGIDITGIRIYWGTQEEFDKGEGKYE